MYAELPSIQQKPVRTQLSAIIMRRRCIWEFARDIIVSVAAKHSVSVLELLEKNRTRPVTVARREAMYLIRDKRNISTPVIGRWFDMDHSSAMYAIEAHAAMHNLPSLFRKGHTRARRRYGRMN